MWVSVKSRGRQSEIIDRTPGGIRKKVVSLARTYAGDSDIELLARHTGFAASRVRGTDDWRLFELSSGQYVSQGKDRAAVQSSRGR